MKHLRALAYFNQKEKVVLWKKIYIAYTAQCDVCFAMCTKLLVSYLAPV